MAKTKSIYISENGQLQIEVAFEQQTVWLTQAQMVRLFGSSKANISEHIKNIFAEGELDVKATVRKFRTVQTEGNRKVSRNIEHYNLDMIISLGYRVHSQVATHFRIWATHTLKQHLIDGYTLNQRRLQERNIQFEQAMTLLSRTLSNQKLIDSDETDVISVISDYARSWSLLLAYDEKSLKRLPHQQTNMQPMNLNNVLAAIQELKKTLITKGEATELFGQLRGNGLASAIASIEQGFGGELFYPNVASRAAHLLYSVIKNHPLVDGNKRSGSFLFLWYLRMNQHLLAKPVEQLINNHTLVALALLVAESPPEQKELLNHLIEHFIPLKEKDDA